MSKPNLRYNLGFLIDAAHGTSTEAEFDYPKITLEDTTFSPLRGQFKATRTSEGIFVNGRFQTETETECVRCLKPFVEAVVSEIEELFYYPPSTAPEEEYVMGEDGNIDLGPPIRELSMLTLPMQPICRPDCRGLCRECGHNLNEGECACEIDSVDPRLAVLRGLIEDPDAS